MDVINARHAHIRTKAFHPNPGVSEWSQPIEQMLSSAVPIEQMLSSAIPESSTGPWFPFLLSSACDAFPEQKKRHIEHTLRRTFPKQRKCHIGHTIQRTFSDLRALHRGHTTQRTFTEQRKLHIWHRAHRTFLENKIPVKRHTHQDAFSAHGRLWKFPVRRKYYQRHTTHSDLPRQITRHTKHALTSQYKFLHYG